MTLDKDQKERLSQAFKKLLELEPEALKGLGEGDQEAVLSVLGLSNEDAGALREYLEEVQPPGVNAMMWYI